MRVSGIVAAGFALAMGTGAAHATTYDFTSGAYPGGLYSVGCQADGNFNGAPCNVTITPAGSSTEGGLGVNGPGPVIIPGWFTFPDLDPSRLDSFPSGSYEALIIGFSSTVKLLGFALGDFDHPPDDYEYSLDGGLTYTHEIAASLTGIDTIVNSLIVAAWSIDTGECDFAQHCDHTDSFTLKSFDIEEIAAVPLPAGGLLLGSALLGLFGLSRRQSRARKMAA
jgi:hypothetical protein